MVLPSLWVRRTCARSSPRQPEPTQLPCPPGSKRTAQDLCVITEPFPGIGWKRFRDHGGGDFLPAVRQVGGLQPHNGGCPEFTPHDLGFKDTGVEGHSAF